MVGAELVVGDSTFDVSHGDNVERLWQGVAPQCLAAARLIRSLHGALLIDRMPAALGCFTPLPHSRH